MWCLQDDHDELLFAALDDDYEYITAVPGKDVTFLCESDTDVEWRHNGELIYSNRTLVDHYKRTVSVLVTGKQHNLHLHNTSVTGSFMCYGSDGRIPKKRYSLKGKY